MTAILCQNRRFRRNTTLVLALFSLTASAHADSIGSFESKRFMPVDSIVIPESDQDDADDALQEPKGPLPLRRALAVSLLQNPDLASFSWEARARESDALQAGLVSNPEINIRSEDFAGTGPYQGFSLAQSTLTLGQLVQLGGKRMKRRKVAEFEHDLATWDYKVRRLDVLTEVTQDFVSVLEAQRRLALAEDLRKLADESLTAVSRRVRAGAASAVEQTRAEVNLSSAEVAKRRTEAALAASRARLASLWGSSAARFDMAVGDLDAVENPPTFDPNEVRIQNNPDIARWATESAQRDAVVTLEDARRIPNVLFKGRVRRYEDGNNTGFVVGFTVPFAVFDRNQGARQAARFRRSKLRSEKRAVITQTIRDLEVALQQLRASYDTVVALRKRVLPQAEEAYTGVRRGYLTGLFRYVDVLDAQRTLFELRNNELSELGRYHRAVAEVERLTGTPIETESAKLSVRDIN